MEQVHARYYNLHKPEKSRLINFIRINFIGNPETNNQINVSTSKTVCRKIMEKISKYQNMGPKNTKMPLS